MSDLDRYTTFKVRKETGDLADKLIEKFRPVLASYSVDSRSGFVTYLLVRLAIKEGLIGDIDDRLFSSYSDLFSMRVREEWLYARWVSFSSNLF